jgi:hypothetical protein
LIVLLTQYKLVKTNEVIPTIDIFDESGNKNPKLEDPLQAVPYEEININHGAVDAILNRPATDLDRIVDDYVSDLDLNKKSTVKVPTDGDGSGRNSNITINISGYGNDGDDKTSTTNNTTTHHIHHNDEETTIKRSVSATKKIVADANEEEINNEPKRVIHAKKHEYVDDLTISDNEEEKVEEEVAPVGPTIIQQTHTHDEHLAKIPASSEITSFKSERKFNQLLMPTPRIAPIVGSEPLTRAEAIKRV